LLEVVASWYGAVNGNPRLSDVVALRNRSGRFGAYGLVSRRDRFDYVCPYLDDELVSVCYGMPERWQRQATAYRRVIERRWPELGKIPWEATGLPVNRYPGSLRRRGRGLRRRFRLGRPIAFTDVRLYHAALREHIDKAPSRLKPLFDELGIDVDGLLADHPPSRWLGRALRLRIATLYLTFSLAGHPFDGPGKS
jgi:hypothetical protein